MNLKISLLASAIVLSLAPAAFADGVGSIELNDKVISVSGHGHHRTFPCNGRKLEVVGSAHVISTTGECSYVDVSGTDHVVDVAIAPKGTLEVAGSNHKVRWKAAGETKQDISGTDHKIVRVK